MISESLNDKLDQVRESLRAMKSVAVAFSAGADSTFVLRVAVDVLGEENVLAVTGRSASVPDAELVEAKRLADRIGARHRFVDTDEFTKEAYTSNPTNRCYHCKTTLYSHMDRVIEEEGIDRIVNGTNVDDLGDYRPGLQAASEHVVASPVVDAGITKAELRELSKFLGLPTFDKPASPCLSSRVPYGQEVTREKLQVIDRGERFIKSEFGLRECRVRHHGEFVRIEVPIDDIEPVLATSGREKLDAFFESLGIHQVEIDPQGFRSGSLNEVIAFGKQQLGA
ncbi:MAG: 7-cyano-7-deazaguanine synthase [Phycisphaerae bacterium]|nr:MAG: 7-cyano-7-deazaguanine synthase [Phycisphaerae bacterium]